MAIKYQETKTLNTRANSRSSDAISPNFIYGCSGSCLYCYAKRNKHFRENIYINENIEDIFKSIDTWVNSQQWPKLPNQVHNTLYGIDIGCSTDVALMWKHQNWPRILNWFSKHPKAFATFATKWVNYDMLPFGEGNRIRFSLIPQKIANKVEPKMASIQARVRAINEFKSAGWDVHINWSPIIPYKGFLRDYEELFIYVNNMVTNKEEVFSECIYLTHSENLHNINVKSGYEEEEKLLWNPKLQEEKISQYKSYDKVVRYKLEYKPKLIEAFQELHEKIIPWNKIRYIF